MNEETEEVKENTKIESLDDLFDEPDVENNEKIVPEETKVASSSTQEPEAPMLPQDDEIFGEPEKQEETVDLQKELESKFDELFGAFEDDDN